MGNAPPSGEPDRSAHCVSSVARKLANIEAAMLEYSMAWIWIVLDARPDCCEIWNLVANSGVTYLLGEATKDSKGLFVRVRFGLGGQDIHDEHRSYGSGHNGLSSESTLVYSIRVRDIRIGLL